MLVSVGDEAREKVFGISTALIVFDLFESLFRNNIGRVAFLRQSPSPPMIRQQKP
jgi:hypothetical protein